MGRPIGPKKVHRYSAEFKLTAVKLTRMPGVEVQTVAAALDIHPIMLSRWRTEALSFVAIMATALNSRCGSKNETARAVERWWCPEFGGNPRRNFR